MLRHVFFLLTVICFGLTNSFAQQDPMPVKRAVDSWLKGQAKDLSGEASHEIGMPAAIAQLAPCGRFEVSRPAGAPTAGRGHVLVRCLDAAGWRIHVPVHIRVKGSYLVAARTILPGQSIAADDLVAQTGDLSELPVRIVTDDKLAIGKVAATAIAAGVPLRTDMLKAMTVVRQGQTVKVVSRGSGFEVANEGRAMSNAAEGQFIQVRMAKGQILGGVAKAGGYVEVSF